MTGMLCSQVGINMLGNQYVLAGLTDPEPVGSVVGKEVRDRLHYESLV